MQITGMLIFLFVWLLILWVGSMALEATGLERRKARFQALSALTGTGFTTREAESIVNHPRRRRIASWLIFLGSVGIVAFIMVMILYLRAGFKAPTISHVGIIIISLVILALIIWTGVINKLSNVVVSWFNRGHPVPGLVTEEILHEAGNYGVARILTKEEMREVDITINDIKSGERELIILAIERGGEVLSLPKDEEVVQAGDCLLCYGKIADISNINNKL